MGIPHLWEILSEAGETRSLTHLAMTQGFPTKHRGFRIGIDASIWLYHSSWSVEGENPELRMFFFRCCKLLRSPFLPVFVFDGPRRPATKRGKRISGKDHLLTDGMKQIIKAFGFRYWMAPGEAEAELAWLNKEGIIDAVLSDDSDTFVFGAKMVIRNASNTLSGNKSNPVLNSAGKDDKNHTRFYTLDLIQTHSSISLDTDDLILLALLMGGDYDCVGLKGCGPKIAFGLARSGFGRTLVRAARSKTQQEMKEFLKSWRTELKHELETNSQGHIGKKCKKLASAVTDAWPSLTVLDHYINPITTQSHSHPHGLTAQEVLKWDTEPNLSDIAHICELKFEWGYYESIIKRFRTNVWEGAVMRIMRRAVLLLDEEQRDTSAILPSTPRRLGSSSSFSQSPGTPSKLITQYFSSLDLSTPPSSQLNNDDDGSKLLCRITRTREHPSTDCLLEYRVEVDPSHLVTLAAAGIQNLRSAPEQNIWAAGSDEDLEASDDGGKKKSGSKKAPPSPNDLILLWFPATLVQIVRPDLVADFDRKQAKKGKRQPKANTSSKSSQKKRTEQKVLPLRDVGSESEPEQDAPLLREVPSTASSSFLSTKVAEQAPNSSSLLVRDLTRGKSRFIMSQALESPSKCSNSKALRSGFPSESELETTPSTINNLAPQPPQRPILSSSKTTTATSTTVSSRRSQHSKPVRSKKLTSAERFLQRQEDSESPSSDSDIPPPSRLSSFKKPLKAPLKSFAATTYLSLSDSETESLQHPPPIAPTRTRPLKTSSRSGLEGELTKSPRKNRIQDSPRRAAGFSARKERSPSPSYRLGSKPAKKRPTFVEVDSEDSLALVHPVPPVTKRKPLSSVVIDLT
ncbi:hypothetical protein DL96DRAFT_1814545 [Flagelloscypha sp. PMI_526]|nr:hypothetical protein DL96DRAFT_1814545 [Flagelloscypha sp. PMI_526]